MKMYKVLIYLILCEITHIQDDVFNPILPSFMLYEVIYHFGYDVVLIHGDIVAAAVVPCSLSLYLHYSGCLIVRNSGTLCGMDSTMEIFYKINISFLSM